MCQTRQAIYEQLARQCTPSALAAPWNGLEIAPNRLRLPSDPDAVLPLLRRQFPDDALVASGVTCRTEDGVELTPRLALPGAWAAFLRESPDGLPFDILTAQGLISRAGEPLFSACRDYRVHAGWQNLPAVLLLAFSMEAYVLLASFGLPVTLAVALDCLGGEQLIALQRMLDTADLSQVAPEGTASQAMADTAAANPSTQAAPGAADAVDVVSITCSAAASVLSQFHTSGTPEMPARRNDEQIQPTMLILVGWRPETLEGHEPPGFGPAVRFLVNVERHLGLDLSAIAAWMPGDADLESMRFRVQYGTREQIRAAMIESIEQNSFALTQLIDGRLGPRPAPEDYATALDELRRRLRDASGSDVTEENLRHVIAQHDAMVDRDLIAPLVERYQGDSDELIRNLGVVVADLFRGLHRRAPFVDARPTRDLAEGREAAEVQLKQVDRVLKVVRELRRE